MSWTGIPSVIQIINGIFDDIASSIESAAKGGGTYITVASGLTSSTHSWTVLKTGRFKCLVPPLPGVTPPTILVPYAIACSEWKVPCPPVNPWQITFVSLLINTDIWLISFNSTDNFHCRII